MKNTIAVIGVLLLMLFPFQITLAEKDCGGDVELRHYSGHVARWLGVDPLADKYPDVSPYAYCEDNPLMYVDPDGMDSYCYDFDDKRFIRMSQTDDEYDVIETYIKNGKVYAFGGWEIAKGILKPNFHYVRSLCVLMSSNVDERDVLNFAVVLSKLMGTEVSGTIWEIYGEKCAYIDVVTSKNSITKSERSRDYYESQKSESAILLIDWHVHPKGYDDSLEASETDKRYAEKLKEIHSEVKCMIIVDDYTTNSDSTTKNYDESYY